MHHEEQKPKADFSTETMEVRRQCNDTFKVLKWKSKNEKPCQAETLFPVKEKNRMQNNDFQTK